MPSLNMTDDVSRIATDRFEVALVLESRDMVSGRELDYSRRRFISPLVLLLTMFFSGLSIDCPVAAEESGTLLGRVVFKGKAPTPEELSLNKDVAVCSKKHPVNEDLLVNSVDGGLANVVVSLELERGQTLPEMVRPESRKLPTEVVMTNRNCRFEPHIAVMTTQQTLVLGNDDPVAHNTLANLLYNSPFNESIGMGSVVKKKLTRAERRPAQISCPIHSWMSGWVVVKDHAFVGVSDSHGRFRITDLPPGEWTFQFWQEKAGYLSKMELKSGTVEDRKGIYKLTIRAGDNDLGDMSVDAALFE